MRFGAAGCRWAQARNAHCSAWAQTFNRQFRSMSAGSFLLNSCEYYPMAQVSGRSFPEQSSISGNAVKMLLEAAAEGQSVGSAIDDAIAAYLAADAEWSNAMTRSTTKCVSSVRSIGCDSYTRERQQQL